jgi:hypothetical protein
MDTGRGGFMVESPCKTMADILRFDCYLAPIIAQGLPDR